MTTTHCTPHPTSTLRADGQEFTDSFESLLFRWNEHQMLRSSGASVDELFESRTRLDATRTAVATSR